MAKVKDEPDVQLATQVPRSLHLAVRVHCVEHDTTRKEFVTTALRDALEKAKAERRGGPRSAA